MVDTHDAGAILHVKKTSVDNSQRSNPRVTSNWMPVMFWTYLVDSDSAQQRKEKNAN